MMYTLFVCLLAAIPFRTLVGAHRTSSRFMNRHRHVARQSANKTYVLQDLYQADDFFEQWVFYDKPDPTNGNVNYLNMQDATSQGLAYIDDCDNSTVLAVDSTSNVPVGGNRNSVRISSNKSYTGGIFILDAASMPVGCGTWPSFWTVSSKVSWPLGGEIDIVEGVNDQANNQMTLHSGTSNACTLTQSNSSASGTFSGNVLGANCFSTPSANAGCGISDPDDSSFGHGFNDAGGGVFVLLWDAASGMSMWHFSRERIPADISNKAPTPANWGSPAGFWSSQTCDIGANFYEHVMVIDTTICGGWAGGAYGHSGCPGTCAEMVANETNFAEAQWRLNYVAVYQ